MAIEVRESKESKTKKLLTNKLLQKEKMTPEEIDILVLNANDTELRVIVAELLKYNQK